jgi:hypothetical protein
MHTLRKFTYPTFIGSCSLLATLSDILQNQIISTGLVIVLTVIGLGGVLLPRRFHHGVLSMFGVASSPTDSLRPFGLSCLMLAAVVFGFSTLSARSAADGGVIASSFPEVREMQIALGRVERQVNQIATQTTEIRKDTRDLVDASIRWISIEAEAMANTRITTTGESHYFPAGIGVRLDNNTAGVFEDLQLLMTADDETIVARDIPLLMPGGYEYITSVMGESFDAVSTCISARRRGKDEWVVDRRRYRIFQPNLKTVPDYQIIEGGEPLVSSTPAACSDET